MAKAPPSFDFYYNDWLGGTYHMSHVARSCYLDLLIYQWQNGSIPDRKLELMDICRISDQGTWDNIWCVIARKFEPISGNLRGNLRMHADRERAISIWEQRIKASKKALTTRLTARSTKRCTASEGGRRKKEEEEEGRNGQAVGIAFDKLWAIYPLRGGRLIGKAEAKAQFSKLDPGQWPDVLRAVAAYAAYCGREDRKPKDPKRFLCNGVWQEWLEAPSEPKRSKLKDRNTERMLFESNLAKRGIELSRAELDAKFEEHWKRV